MPSGAGVNAMYSPSGDHTGNWPKTLETRVRFDPSGFITYSPWYSPRSSMVSQSVAFEYRQSSRMEVKAILVPSGDHAGHPSSPRKLVNRVTPDPSAFITKIS